MSDSNTGQPRPTPWREILRVHQGTDAFPPLNAKELAELAEDIHKNGLFQRVELWEVIPEWPANKGKKELVLIDGRNRLDALELLAAKYPDKWKPLFDQANHIQAELADVVGFHYSDAPSQVYRGTMTPGQVLARIIGNNIRRRHLTYDQRVAAAARLAELLVGQGKQRQIANLKQGLEKPEGPKSTPRDRAAVQAAKELDVGTTAVKEVIAAEKGEPGTIEKLKKGDITMAKVRKPRAPKPKLAPVAEATGGASLELEKISPAPKSLRSLLRLVGQTARYHNESGAHFGHITAITIVVQPIAGKEPLSLTPDDIEVVHENELANNSSTDRAEPAGERPKRRKSRIAKPDPGAIREIYQAYPRHVGRQAAEKKIASAIEVVARRDCNGNHAEAAAWLLNRVQKFARSPCCLTTEKQYIKHPATWFHQGCYDDDDQEWGVTSNGNRSTAAERNKERIEKIFADVGEEGDRDPDGRLSGPRL